MIFGVSDSHNQGFHIVTLIIQDIKEQCRNRFQSSHLSTDLTTRILFLSVHTRLKYFAGHTTSLFSKWMAFTAISCFSPLLNYLHLQD